MIDFHSHILPGIDDGSRNMEQSIQILKEAKEAGFSKVISTSHYMEEYFECDEAKRRELLEYYVNARLDKSIQSYYEELMDSYNALTKRDAARVLRRAVEGERK